MTIPAVVPAVVPVVVPAVTAAAEAQNLLPVRIYLTMSLVVMGSVLIAMGRMGARRTLSPNGLFGIRTRRTTRSEAVWYEVHAAAAPWSLAAGIISIVGIVPVLLLDDDLLFVALLLSVGAGLVVLGAGVVLALRRASTDER